MVAKTEVILVAGPTASGKSAHALALAQTCRGVIINADSLQLYDGLAQLTAHPSVEDKALIPHYLYGVIPPDQSVTVMDWRRMALETIYMVRDAGYTPIVVGGTGFYLKTLMQGLSPIPEIPNDVRVLAEDLMDRVGIAEFFAQLKIADPVIAERIDPFNRQRLIRAYEVFLYTGKPLSSWHSIPSVGIPEDLEFKPVVILPEREVLYNRCNTRFDKMVSCGVIDEVRAFDDAILAGKIPFDCPLTHALGFQPLQAYVRGEMDLDTAIVLSKNETRHYAKRQVTWFKHQMPVGQSHL